MFLCKCFNTQILSNGEKSSAEMLKSLLNLRHTQGAFATYPVLGFKETKEEKTEFALLFATKDIYLETRTIKIFNSFWICIGMCEIISTVFSTSLLERFITVWPSNRFYECSHAF